MKSIKKVDNCCTYIGAERFSWVTLYGKKTGVAEVSDLQGLRLSRMWSDACDIGFICVSPVTGREVPFVLIEEIDWEDGGQRVFEDTEGLDLSISIFND